MVWSVWCGGCGVGFGGCGWLVGVGDGWWVVVVGGGVVVGCGG